MDEAALIAFLTEELPGVEIVSADGNAFFYYAPHGKIPKRGFPFATLVANDAYDTASELNRPGVFRLNIGISRERFAELCGPDAVHDFTALDTIMPHPIYGNMAWVCVLSPAEKTSATVRLLLEEAWVAAGGKR